MIAYDDSSRSIIIAVGVNRRLDDVVKQEHAVTCAIAPACAQRRPTDFHAGRQVFKFV